MSLDKPKNIESRYKNAQPRYLNPHCGSIHIAPPEGFKRVDPVVVKVDERMSMQDFLDQIIAEKRLGHAFTMMKLLQKVNWQGDDRPLFSFSKLPGNRPPIFYMIYPNEGEEGVIVKSGNEHLDDEGYIIPGTEVLLCPKNCDYAAEVSDEPVVDNLPETDFEQEFLDEPKAKESFLNRFRKALGSLFGK